MFDELCCENAYSVFKFELTAFLKWPLVISKEVILGGSNSDLKKIVKLHYENPF